MANAYAGAAYPASYQQAGITPAGLILASACYSLASGAVAVGAWRRTSWVGRAVLMWGAVLLLAMAGFQGMVGVAGEPAWLVVLPHVIFALLAWAVYRFVRGRTRATALAT